MSDELKYPGFSDLRADRAYLDDPPQPNMEEPFRMPSKTRKVDGVLYLAPEGPAGAHYMFIAGCPTPEEASSVAESPFGEEILQKPCLLKGAAGQLLGDLWNRIPGNNFKNDARYVSAVPWLLPRSRRFQPKAKELAWTREWLDELIDRERPRKILALGKAVFDAITGLHMDKDDVKGAWFSSRQGNIPVYLLEPVHTLATQPWMSDQFLVDFREVSRFDRRRVAASGMDFREIRTMEQLEALVAEWEAGGYMRFSVDCEWGRTNFVDGMLRSIQFCWKDGTAAYLNFFDETGEPVLAKDFNGTAMDVPVELGDGSSMTVLAGSEFTDYKAVGLVLGRWLNRPEVRYIGHHISADFPWMRRFLGLETYRKCEFDTEFALQTVDEYAKLGLDQLALRYTEYGRYDMDLILWKRDNRLDEDDGYGTVPDSILIPYACLDVVVPWIASRAIQEELEEQGLSDYHRDYIVPFVSDVFTCFSETGLPVNRERMRDLKGFMNWLHAWLLEGFREKLRERAEEIARERLGDRWDQVADLLIDARENQRLGVASEIFGGDKAMAQFWLDTGMFNPKSTLQVQRWLFDVQGLTPVKSTGNKAKGTPSMPWSRVMELPEHVRKTMVPAVDKESLALLADQESLLNDMLSVSNVANLCNGFLKRDDLGVGGEVVRENGVAKFVASDNRIHGQFSLTETSRPRSWKPNILNLQAYLNDYVKVGLERLLTSGISIPGQFLWLFSGETVKEKIQSLPTIRHVVEAPEGWCLAGADYKTAEIRAVAFVFKDPDLIRLMTEPDCCFALDRKGKPVRIGWPKEIPESARDPRWLYAKPGSDGQEKYAPEELLNLEGRLEHPAHDLHWSLAELNYRAPREELDEDRDRKSAKTANFSCLAGYTEVLTEAGLVPLVQLRNSTRVWDGSEWVGHGGVVSQGWRLVLTYKGLTATPDHVVWDGHGRRVCFGDAVLDDTGLWRACWGPPGPGDTPARDVWLEGRKQWYGQENGRWVEHFERLGLEVFETEVYDILNAGPRRRFTAEGMLVSNCFYGITPPTLERRIEVSIGQKVEPGTGQALLDAIKERQPIAMAALEELATAPERGEILRAASGRVRRFPVHPSTLRGLHPRVRASYLRPMGNEARNFFPQELVAATSIRACKGILDFCLRTGLKARPVVCLYDYIGVLCPDEERFIVQRLLKWYMTESNVWQYGGRWFNFPIDLKVAKVWDRKPDKAWAEKIKDRSYKPLDEALHVRTTRELAEEQAKWLLANSHVFARLNRV